MMDLWSIASDYVNICREVLAGVNRLEHGRDLPHLGELGRALGKPNAGIRGDQPDTLQPTFLEMLEERAPTRLIIILLRPLADAENLPVTARAHDGRRRDGGERAAQGLRVHSAPAKRCNRIIEAADSIGLAQLATKTRNGCRYRESERQQSNGIRRLARRFKRGS
jgi:hypothetical protein